MAQKALLTGRFMQRKLHEYETIKAEIEAIQSEASTPEAQRATAP
jgi:hypothetical protein